MHLQFMIAMGLAWLVAGWLGYFVFVLPERRKRLAREQAERAMRGLETHLRARNRGQRTAVEFLEVMAALRSVEAFRMSKPTPLSPATDDDAERTVLFRQFAEARHLDA